MKIRRQSNTFQFEEDSFSKNGESIIKNYHEVLLLKKILQTKPQDKSVNTNFNDMHYTVIRNRDDKEIVDEQC